MAVKKETRTRTSTRTREPEPATPKKNPSVGDRARSAFQRISAALNPVERGKPAAKKVMDDANENYGGGARRRHIDDVVDRATGDKPKRGSKSKR